MGINRDLKEKITQCLVEEIGPEKVIIFGSYARGEATSNSDLDLMVIVDPSLDNVDTAIKCRIAVRRAMHNESLPFDLVLQSESLFNQKKEIKGSLQETIAKEGKILYERQQ